MNCFYLNTFYSVLTFFIRLPIFILILIIIVLIIFVMIVFVIVIVIIIFSFSMLLTFIFLVFTILFYLCIYRIFLNFKQIMWPKHCSKLALKILRLYQCLWWEFWTLFAYLILLTIFFWSDTVMFCPWQLFILFWKYFLV